MDDLPIALDVLGIEGGAEEICRAMVKVVTRISIGAWVVRQSSVSSAR